MDGIGESPTVSMAHTQNYVRLCSACKTLTFTLLRDGYIHPLMYESTISSGKTCQLCRLIVCTMGKLQTGDTCYELEKKYDSIADKLSQLPAVSRHWIEGASFPPIVESLNLPSNVVWSRNQYLFESDSESQVRKGNFNDGETIQITAPDGLIPLPDG